MGDKHAEQSRAEAMASALQTVAAAARKIADGPSIKELQEMTAHIKEVVSESYNCPSATTGKPCSAEGAPLMWDCGKPCKGSCIKAPMCCPQCGSSKRTMQNPAPPVIAQAKKKAYADYYYAGNDILAGNVVYRATFAPLQVGDWTLVEQDGYLRAGMVAVIVRRQLCSPDFADPSRMEVAVDVHFDPKYDKPEMNGVAVRHWVSRLTALYRKVREGTFVEGMMVRGKLSGRLGFVRSKHSESPALVVEYPRECNPVQQASWGQEFADPAMIISGWGDKCPSRTYTRRLNYAAKPIEVGDWVVTLGRGEHFGGVTGGHMGAPAQSVARVIKRPAAVGDQIVLLNRRGERAAGSVGFIAKKSDDGKIFEARVIGEVFILSLLADEFVVVEG